jgi:chaperonin GroEL
MVCEQLDKMSQAVTTEEQIRQIALVSSNHDEAIA